jgi:hypothetical protein
MVSLVKRIAHRHGDRITYFQLGYTSNNLAERLAVVIKFSYLNCTIIPSVLNYES